MVEDFGIAKDPKDIGWYVGILASSFGVLQILTTMYWSNLSNRIGRKPIILLGLLGTSSSILMVGLSKTFWMAVIVRSLNGLLNGTVSLARTMISEITDDTNRSKAFSFFPVCWNVGSIGIYIYLFILIIIRMVIIFFYF